MTRYVVLLRGVNLGGRAKVSMAALRDTCLSIGCEDVATYIQSGNVVLRSDLEADALRERLASAMADQLGVPATVMVRTAAQVARVIRDNPFPEADPGTLHVAFLSSSPDGGAEARLTAASLTAEAVAIRGAQLYLYLPKGLGRSKLAAAVINPKRLGVAATVRNWRTVNRLVEMSASRRSARHSAHDRCMRSRCRCHRTGRDDRRRARSPWPAA
jgi:uncharacterized protein (DUF1697 family)